MEALDEGKQCVISESISSNDRNSSKLYVDTEGNALQYHVLTQEYVCQLY